MKPIVQTRTFLCLYIGSDFSMFVWCIGSMLYIFIFIWLWFYLWFSEFYLDLLFFYRHILKLMDWRAIITECHNSLGSSWLLNDYKNWNYYWLISYLWQKSTVAFNALTAVDSSVNSGLLLLWVFIYFITCCTLWS